MQLSPSSSSLTVGAAPTAAGMLTAMVAGSVALLMLGLQPIVLGEMLGAGRVTLEGVGLVAMAEIVALGLGVLLGDWLGWLGRLRALTAVAALGIVALDAWTPWVQGDGGIALVRAAAGLAEGLLLWVTTAVIVRSGHPARVAGVFFVAQTAAQAVLGLALARWLIPAYGWQAGFGALATAGAIPLLLVGSLPRRLAPLAQTGPSSFRWSASAMQPLFAAFLLMASLGAFWAYAEPLGLRAGLDAQGAQTVIAVALLAQIVGGTIGTALVRRLRAARALSTSALVLGAIGLAIFATPAASVWFSPLCMVFAFIWLFMTPFHTAFAFAADESGRVASLMPVAQLLGSAAGPLVASLVVEGEDASRSALVCAVFAAAALVVLARRWRAHPLPSLQH